MMATQIQTRYPILGVAMKSKGTSLIEGTYRKITRELESNNYAIGTKLQPIRHLAKKFNVSYLTAQRAIKALQLQGVLEAKPGDGLYVVGKPKSLKEGALELLSKKNNPIYRNHKKNGDSYSIGVVMPFWISERGSAVVYEIVKGIVSESDKNQWPVELIHNSDNESELPAFVEKIHQRNFNGIVWLQPTPWHKMNLMRLVDLGYDLAVTSRNFKDIPTHSVQFDHRDMARKIAHLFLDEKGVKKFGLITGPIEGFGPDPYSIDIVEALREEFTRRGCNIPDELICQAFFSSKHELIVDDFMRSNPDLDGLICLHELETSELEQIDRLIALGAGKARKVPMVEISGIFNISLHQMEYVDVVAIEWPLENMGKAVIRKFEENWLNEEEVCTDKIDLSVNLLLPEKINNTKLMSTTRERNR